MHCKSCTYMYVGNFSQPLTNSGEHVENYSVHFHFQGLSISFLGNHPCFGGFDLRIKQEGQPPQRSVEFHPVREFEVLGLRELKTGQLLSQGLFGCGGLAPFSAVKSWQSHQNIAKIAQFENPPKIQKLWSWVDTESLL